MAQYSRWRAADGSNIGGTTLNAWSGVGMGTLDAEALTRIVLKRNASRRRWREVSALVIDESERNFVIAAGHRASGAKHHGQSIRSLTPVSMVDGHLLDKLDYVARQVRGDGRPFGGIQVSSALCPGHGPASDWH